MCVRVYVYVRLCVCTLVYAHTQIKVYLSGLRV